jgi:broad specificity phosphatase PhoE
MTMGRTIVIAARHGERQDHANIVSNQENWVATAKRPWDPPLSELGHVQGKALGYFVRDCLQQYDLPPVRHVYTSPFLRCRQTAVAANFVLDKDVRIEVGLAESLNEAWYRSWALPTSNGMWNYKERDEEGNVRPINLDTLHRAALFPATELIVPAPDSNMEGIDVAHKSRTSLFHCKRRKTYCWGSFETNLDQKARLQAVVNAVARCDSTVVLVSHGGPVTHLFEQLTKKPWHEHGEASYASCSVYEFINGEWTTLVKNESSFVPKIL